MKLNHSTSSILLAMLLALALVAAGTPGAVPVRAALTSGIRSQQGQGFTPVYDIQGAGLSSPLVDMRVDTFGVVTGLTPRGFYLQDPAGDGDPRTSDGVYVFTYTQPAVRTGDCIAVFDALVQEYYGKTELTWIGDVERSDACLTVVPVPAMLSAPRLGVDSADLYESLEGMLVELHGLDGFVHGPTKRYKSGEAEIAFLPVALQPAVKHGRIMRNKETEGLADDVWAGDSLQYLSSLIGGELPSADWGDRIRSGQGGADPLRAVIDYNFGKYQLLLLPGESVIVDDAMVDGEMPAVETGLATSSDDFTVCTFNVHGLGRGEAQFPADADYERALDRRARMIAESMQGCTIIGVQETGTPADASALASWLQQQYALPYHAVSDDGPATADFEFPLTNSFLVRVDRVQVVDWYGAQGCSGRDYEVRVIDGGQCPLGQFPLFNRPPLVMDVQVTGEWGTPFNLRLVNNHWKSKAGDEDVNGERRFAQAQHVAGIVHEWLEGGDDRRVIVLGDLNDFTESAPLSLLTEHHEYWLVNVWDFLSEGDRYTFIFNGASQVLDHILISPDMVQFLSGVDALHGNVDLAMCGPENGHETCQVSDHDPLMIRLRPEGAAAAGGDLGFPGIGVQLEHVESGELSETITGDDGAFRLWDIQPGAVTIQYTMPDWLTVDGAFTTTVLSTGFMMLDAP